MAGSARPIARSEGVSTLKPSEAPSEPADGSASSEPLVSRQTREDRAAARVAAASRGGVGTERVAERADAPLATEQSQLEQREGRLEEKIDAARERGDTKAVRTLQSQLDTTRNELKSVQAERDAWPAWVIAQANAGVKPEAMVEAIKKAQAQRQAAKAIAVSGEPNEIISGLIDSGDDDDLAFARFLRKRIKNEIPVNERNLQMHRDEFEELRGATASANGDARTAPAGVKRPPKLAGAGGSDLGGEKTGWRPNVPTVDLLSQGFAEQDAQRRRH